MTKGAIRVPDPVFEEVLSVVASMSDHEVFMVRDIHAKLKHRKYQQVHQVIYLKAKQGALDRMGRGKYRKGGTRVKTTMPHGLVVDAVWAVLFTSQKQDIMRLLEILGEAESYLGAPRILSKGTVGRILHIWYQGGHLERTGKRGGYAYRLKPDVIERPICTGA